MQGSRQDRCEVNLCHVQAYLKDGVYPPAATDGNKRLIRKRSKDFTIRDGIMYYVKQRNKRIVLLEEKDKRQAFRECHESSSGGHQGRDRTENKMKTYYWPSMTIDIRQWISECDSCQRTNQSIKSPTLDLQPVPVSGLWSLWGVDIVGPLHLTSSGNRYIIVATDYLSKWPEAAALQNKNATSVARFLYSLYCRYGAGNIITDQGREFVNEVTDSLCRTFQMDHRITSAYHPQSNGLCERMNQTIIRSLQKVIDDEYDKWDQALESVLFAIRTSIQSSTKYSPYEIAFGRKVTLPLEHAIKIPNGFPSFTASSEQASEQSLEIRADVTQKAMENIISSQKKQVALHRERCVGKASSSIKVGDLVMLKNKRQASRKGEKLARRFLGPYTIDAVSTKGQVTLRNKSGVVLRVKHSIRNIKKYNSLLSVSSTRRDSGLETSSKTLTRSGAGVEKCADNELSASESNPLNDKPKVSSSDTTQSNPAIKEQCLYTPAHCALMTGHNGIKDSKRHSVLMQNIQHFGLKLRSNVLGDGNCLFSSVCDQLIRLKVTRKRHNVLHQEVVQFMTHKAYTSDGTHLSNFVQAKSWESYLNDMSKTGTWGTHLELQAIASMLHVTICVITDSISMESSMVWLYPDENDEFKGTPVLLIACEMENHYFSLTPIDVLSTEIKPSSARFLQHCGGNPLDETYALSLDGWKISKAQAECIIDDKWIGSEIITFYMKLLEFKHKSSCIAKDSKRDAFMTTYFYQRWQSFLQNKRCEQKKVKSTEHPCNEIKEDLHSIGRVFVPINVANKHWILCVIDFDAKVVTCYDSLVESDSYPCQGMPVDMLAFVEELHRYQGYQATYSSLKWTFSMFKSAPQQENSSDCGLFVCKVAEKIANLKPVTFKTASRNLRIWLFMQLFSSPNENPCVLENKLILNMLKAKAVMKFELDDTAEKNNGQLCLYDGEDNVLNPTLSDINIIGGENLKDNILSPTLHSSVTNDLDMCSEQALQLISQITITRSIEKEYSTSTFDTRQLPIPVMVVRKIIKSIEPHLRKVCKTEALRWKEVYVKLRGKMPTRKELLQIADTWPIKAFEPLNKEICHYVAQLVDDEYADIGYTKSGFSFALNNLVPEAMITVISQHYEVTYDLAAEHYIKKTLPSHNLSP